MGLRWGCDEFAMFMEIMWLGLNHLLNIFIFRSYVSNSQKLCRHSLADALVYSSFGCVSHNYFCDS